MLKYDVKNFTTQQLDQLARKVQGLDDFKLPRLRYWNYDPCRQHRMGWTEEKYNPDTDQMEMVKQTGPNPKCTKCGIEFMQHQRIAVMWMYFRKKGLLADTPGLGKTFEALGLLAMAYETGEIPKRRAVIVTRSPALRQWEQQIYRALPFLEGRLLVVDGSKHNAAKRKQLYVGGWEVLLLGPQVFRRDYTLFEKLGPFGLVITDDVDELRNPDTDTSYAIDRVGSAADRFFVMTGSPLQKRLPELHAVLDGVGGIQRLGPRDIFMNRHIKFDTISEKDQYGREQSVTKISGYKNLDVVKKAVSPIVLRRTAEDITDQRFPDVVVDDVFLDLYTAQRARYRQLQRDVLTLIKDDGTEQTKKIQAIAKLHYGASICAGLTTLGEEDGPGMSSKFDWVMNTIDSDGALGSEKVVIFCNLKRSIRTLQNRMHNRGIKHVTVWGEETDKSARLRSQEQFWNDPDTRVLLGTRAIEQSLNLQVARHLINVDLIMNPERMVQLTGRIRRLGSEHSRVFVHNLLTNDTQEERYLPLLEREAALSSFIWDEESPIFKQLSALEMSRLITG